MLSSANKHILFIVTNENKDDLYHFVGAVFSNCIISVVSNLAEATVFLEEYPICFLIANPIIKDISLFDWIKDQNGRDFHWVVLADNTDYIPNAFENGASGYLQFPLNTEQLNQTLCYLHHQISNKNGHCPDRINENNIPIPKEDILFVAANGDYSVAYLNSEKEEKIPLSINLKTTEELLVPEGFFRVHKQYLVNTQYVKNGGEMYPEIDGDVNKKYIRLVNGHKIEVARRRRKAFKEFMRDLRQGVKFFDR